MKKFIVKLIKKYKRQIFYASILLVAFILLFPLFTYLIFASDIKDKENIINRGKTGLTLLDRDGVPFFAFYQPKEIDYISLASMSASTQQAVIASEDKDFYTNPGFSIRGIIRAVFINISEGKIVQGGSTITQELVKNQFLDSNKNFLRKYQEIVLASEINRRYSKKDILEMYLNSVYFGEGAFGVENASLAYFGIKATDLSLAQSALLIGLLPAPSSLSPLSNDPSLALARQKIVLAEMVQDKLISKSEADAAAKATISYSPITKEEINTLAPHFALFVKDQLIKKYGEENVIRRGMKVTTSLSSAWQEYAENIVKNQVTRLSANNTSNGAAIVMDPKTGEILVMVGSENWNNESHGKINMTLRPRQPGSSFKPIIYADALERRLLTPATILQDKKTTFQGNYQPHNYDNKTRGPVTVRRALANSLNIPAVIVMEQVGINNGLSMAKKLGITTLGNDTSKYGLSLVLGAGEVKLLELTNAYAVFANKGVYNPPASILQITDKYGKTIDSIHSQSRNVLGEDTAFLISSILADNKTRSETFGGALTIARPAAVKTGTTEDYRDALTVGYTPSLAIGIWIGNNDNSPMDNVAGALGAAPIWRQMMEHFLAGTIIEKFNPPAGIVSRLACPYQGITDKLSTSSAFTEYFIQGTQSKFTCPTPPPTPTASPAPTTEPTSTPAPTGRPTSTPRPTTTPIPTSTPAPNELPTETPLTSESPVLPTPTNLPFL